MVRGPGASWNRPLTRSDRSPGKDGRDDRRRSAAAPDRVAAERAAGRGWGSSSPESPTKSGTPWPASGASPSSGDADLAWATKASTTSLTRLIGSRGSSHGFCSSLGPTPRISPRATSTLWRPKPHASPRTALREQEIRVELDLEPDLPPIQMAPPALVQVLRNLTTNALQVMPRGGVLRLATHLDAARGTVAASVADDGPGLSDEILSHLFQTILHHQSGGNRPGLGDRS